MELKQQVLNALHNSLVPDPQKLKQSTQLLTELRQNPGYCIILMEIVDHQAHHLSIKQAALIQLKNTIKLRWKSKKYQITPNDKEMIKSAIITAIIRSTHHHKLIKLYKEILTIVVTHEFKQWIPLQPIVEKLRKNQDLPAMMHCLIAMAASFQFSITPQERTYYFQFLKVTLPQLTRTLDNNQTPQLIYLNLKFLWKAVHYEINEEVRELTLNWMNLLYLVISISNPQFEHPSIVNSIFSKNTPQFYYFHSKKWATRILLRFIQKHAKCNLPKKSIKNIQFAQSWYNNYGSKFVELIFQQLKLTNCTVKVRFFQMKCIQVLASQKPDIIKPLAQVLQYQILPPYLQLKPQDEQLANSDPIEFLNKQMEPCINFTNLKKVASDVWVAIAEIGSKSSTDKSQYQAGDYFHNNITYLKCKLESNNQLEKQFAMYLICQLRITILKCPQVKAVMPGLISSYIIPEFRNEIMFLRARAVDIFYDYGSIGFPIDVISKATEGIYICLTQDQNPIVRIKAASAFNCILRHKQAKQLVRPLLKDILTVYLKLLEQYDLEILVNSLENIVEDFSSEIEPFAQELTKYMIKLFIRLFQKDEEQVNNEDYAGDIELAAAGCLKTVTQIIDAPLSSNTINLLHSDIIELSYFIFSSSAEDYIQDLLLLLNSYLYKVSTITPQLWFFYQVVIYNITGIPASLWKQIENHQLSQIQKKVLTSVKGGGNYEMMEQTALVLRNYIRKGSKIIINNSDAFRTNMLQLLLFLVGEVYKKGPGQYSGEIQMTCTMSLLVNFLENNENVPQAIIIHFLQPVRYNIIKNKSKSMKMTNIQLISLLIYRGDAKFISLIINQTAQPPFNVILKEIIDNHSKLSQEHQYKRMILGLTTLVRFKERSQEMLDSFQAIFKILVKMVKKNMESRIEETQEHKNNIKQNQIENDEEFDDENDNDKLEDILNGDDDGDDDDDFWEQLYGENYQSYLDDVDEIKYFSDSLHLIQAEEPAFYSQMLKILTEQQLMALSQKINIAIELFKIKT